MIPSYLVSSFKRIFSCTSSSSRTRLSFFFSSSVRLTSSSSVLYSSMAWFFTDFHDSQGQTLPQDAKQYFIKRQPQAIRPGFGGLPVMLLKKIRPEFDMVLL